MKKLIRLVVFALVILVAVLGVLLLVRDPLIKSVAEKQIRQQTGMPVTIGLFHVGLREPVVRIENLRLYNPPGFDNARFVDIPEIHVEYDRAALLSRKLHLKLVRFNLADLSVVENAEGKTNIRYLQERQKQMAAKSGEKKPSEPMMKFEGIDTLNLTLGRVRFTSLKHPERAREINLNVKNYEMKNVKSAADFSGLVVGIMMKNGVTFLGEGVSAAAGLATDLATDVAKDATDTAGKGAKKLLDTVTSPFKKKE